MKPREKREEQRNGKRLDVGKANTKGAAEEEEPEGGREGEREHRRAPEKEQGGLGSKQTAQVFQKEEQKDETPVSPYTGKCLPASFTLFQNQPTWSFTSSGTL